MTVVKITAGPFLLSGRLEVERAPKTCAHFSEMLPFRNKLIHVRWSGEGCWIPMGDTPRDIPVENATSYPAPGQFIFYPGGFSETEILLAYGGVRFASKLGQLAGNHFLTVTQGAENLQRLGRLTLHEGAQDLLVELG
jgi:hypothetical protein